MQVHYVVTVYSLCSQTGQSLYNIVLLSFFKLQYKKADKITKKLNKHDVSGSISVEKSKPVAFFFLFHFFFFLCCKLNFYLTYIYGVSFFFLQALKQKIIKEICSNVQLFFHISIEVKTLNLFGDWIPLSKKKRKEKPHKANDNRNLVVLSPGCLHWLAQYNDLFWKCNLLFTLDSMESFRPNCV